MDINLQEGKARTIKTRGYSKNVWELRDHRQFLIGPYGWWASRKFRRLHIVVWFLSDTNCKTSWAWPNFREKHRRSGGWKAQAGARARAPRVSFPREIFAGKVCKNLSQQPVSNSQKIRGQTESHSARIKRGSCPLVDNIFVKKKESR